MGTFSWQASSRRVARIHNAVARARRWITMPKVPVRPLPETAPVESLEQRFRRLEAVWEADTQFLSDAQRIIEHPAFQEIIELGREVVPLMLRDLARGP